MGSKMDMKEIRLGNILVCKSNLVRAVVMAKCSTGVIVYNYTNNAFEVLPYHDIDKATITVDDRMSMIDETNELKAFTSKFINTSIDYMNEHYKIYENIISNNDVLKSSKELFDTKYIDRKQVKDTRTNRIYSIVDIERINNKLYYSLNRVRSINRTLHEESLFIDSDELKEGFVFEEDLLHPKTKSEETLENNEYISTNGIKEMFDKKEEVIEESKIVDTRSDIEAILDGFNIDSRFRKPVKEWSSKNIGTLSNIKMEKIYDEKLYGNIIDYFSSCNLQFLHTEHESKVMIIEEAIDIDNIKLRDEEYNNKYMNISNLIHGVICKNNNQSSLFFAVRCLTFMTMVYNKDFIIYDYNKHATTTDVIDNVTEILHSDNINIFRYNPIVKYNEGKIILYKDIPMVIVQCNKNSYSVLFNVFSDEEMELGYLTYSLCDKLHKQGDIKIIDQYNFNTLFNIVNEEYKK